MTRLYPEELAFLKEYAAMQQPLSLSIDLLQKLARVTFTAHIVAGLIEVVDCRFEALLSSHESKMATATKF